MNYLVCVFILFSLYHQTNGGLFDRYSGKKIDEKLSKGKESKNSTKECVIDIKVCTPHEGSRVDGTCNNYKFPSTGAARGPYMRMLKPEYGANNTIRSNSKGKPFPSARKVRTTLQSTGRVEDKTGFNVAAVHFLEFINRDISLLNGPMDYLKHRHHCCNSDIKDPRCAPIEVPNDDPYLKVTDIRCLNFSRAETFQDAGCPQVAHPEQINFQTPLLDLSTIYGVDEESLNSVRKWEDGLLKEHLINGHNDSIAADDVCLPLNVNETVCYKFGFPEAGNVDLRTTMLGIFFIREHNRIARTLHRINPCWKDDRLFKVARQINIATAANIFTYELLPALMGYRNMINSGIISERIEYVTAYDADAVPLAYAEYELAMKFFHTFWSGRIKKYDEHFHYIGDLSLSETLFKQELIRKDKNFVEISRGTFIQPAGQIDDILDPEISESFYSEMQKAHDLASTAIQRGRDMGIPGYNRYRKICGMRPAKKFEDFLDAMDIEILQPMLVGGIMVMSEAFGEKPELQFTMAFPYCARHPKMENLKQLYDDVEDVELLAGIISENFVHGTHVGPTLFCIITKQLHSFRFADRFWFERGDQFHSFTLAQLREMRRSNMARFACDNGMVIGTIQPRAFYVAGYRNMPTPCSHISGPDLGAWRDSHCRKEGDGPKHQFSSSERVNVHQPSSYMQYLRFFDTMINYKPNNMAPRAKKYPIFE